MRQAGAAINGLHKAGARAAVTKSVIGGAASNLVVQSGKVVDLSGCVPSFSRVTEARCRASTRLTAAALALDGQEVSRQLEFKDVVVVRAARSLEEIELIRDKPFAGVDPEEGPGTRNLLGAAAEVSVVHACTLQFALAWSDYNVSHADTGTVPVLAVQVRKPSTGMLLGPELGAPNACMILRVMPH